MIRYIFIGAMTAVLCIVLYLPARYAPEEFMAVVRSEHNLCEEVWGTEVASQVLDRMLRLQQSAASISTPPPAAASAAFTPSSGTGAASSSSGASGASGASDAVSTAVAGQLGQVSAQLFGNAYFRSIDALFALVTYRMSCTFQLLPMLIVFLMAVSFDGLIVRKVRARELVAHSAEKYSASLGAAILVGAGVIVAWFLPWTVHPMALLGALLLMLYLLSRAVANYHLLH